MQDLGGGTMATNSELSFRPQVDRLKKIRLFYKCWKIAPCRIKQTRLLQALSLYLSTSKVLLVYIKCFVFNYIQYKFLIANFATYFCIIVSYSNLLKTSVALDNDFSYRLDRHLKSAMDDLKLITHDLFMSLQEMSEHLLWNVGIQLMSTGLIGIAECDPDPTIMNQLAEMFGINYNEMDPNILKFEVGEHLLVQQMLRDAIIHEGQCSSITSGMVRDQKHIDREVECLGSEIISTNEDRLNLIPKKRNFYTLNQNNLIDSLQADIYGFKCCVQDNDTNDDEFQGVELFDLFQDTEIHSSK